MITEVELNKLLSAAQDACTKASDGDKAEEGRAVDALKVLAQQQVTADLLGKTEAGKRVRKLTKHTSSKIAEAANSAVEAWKECVRLEQASKTGSKSASVPSQQGSTGNNKEASQEQGGAGSQGMERATSNKLVLEPAKTGDDTRDKIRKLLAEALATALSGDLFGDPCATAVDVEEAMYNQNGGVNAKYKAKYRTLSFNLKDPKNPELRGKVLTGEIPGDVLVNLSAEELASTEQRAKNEAIREAMKAEAVRGQSNQASTDMFQCGKCKQRKCTYYQLQTRSADEPMTTFVTCTNCGNRWKFC
mmetsp:Transcript_26665/g.67928  ORF Transcript_26665/g.67928 Transcript_26665/m.67928 type:complete len:304 (-) Transcript_26665:396-1307(-)